MNLQESIRRILKEEVTEDKNLYGEKLKACSTKPMTGFYRDGYCKTGDDDTGSHTVCARVTEEFLEFTKSMGNNLDMLEPGDKWCLCAKRWEEANKEGVAPEMIKSSTNIKTLNIIDSVEQELDEYARTLKNARRQGVGLRFSKSAVKANPQRFRKYTRDNINESRTNSSLNNLLNMLFDGFDDIYYDWANYMCGMGECCDPYAIGFTLPENDYDDYIFKLVDGEMYDDDADYPKEFRDELPEPCYQQPDIKDPKFDTIVFYGAFAEEIEDYMGHERNWRSDLLKIINNQFGCDAKRIIII